MSMHHPGMPSPEARAAIDGLKSPEPPSLTKRTKELVEKEMPEGVAADFMRAIPKPSRSKRQKRVSSTMEGYAKWAVYACRVCASAGVKITCYASLASIEALDALERQVKRNIWTGQYLATILSSIHAILQILDPGATPLLRTSITDNKGLPRRRRPRQCSNQSLLDGAVAISAVADIAEAAGQVERSKALRSDAALLASASQIHGRRSEYSASNMSMVKRRTAGGATTIQFYWDRNMRKNNQTRIAIVRDPRAIALLDHVTLGRSEGAVFRTFDDRPLEEWAVYLSLRRSTFLALGRRVCPTGIRAAGTDGASSPVEMGDAIGSSPNVAAEYYGGSLMSQGLSFLRGCR